MTFTSLLENFFGKSVKFIKFLRRNLKFIIIFIGFTYQAIDLTIGYLKYETVFSIKKGSKQENMPAVSFCVNSEKQISNINMIKNFASTLNDYLFLPIIVVKGYQNQDNMGFENSSHIIESVTPFGYKCFTYFSELLHNRHLILVNKSISFFILNSLNLTFILHSSKTPPHLFSQMFRYRYESLTFYREK
jgi:hypothetical protein